MRIKISSNDYCNKCNSVAFKKIIRNDIPAKSLNGNKYLLLISGPSGVGKDTIMNEIIHKFNKIVTHTTRPKREGEIDGKSYFFTTADKFIKGIKNNEFLEYVQGFSGNYYGTKRETVKNALNGEKPALLIVDTDGANSIRNNIKNAPFINVISIFFKPPSFEVLKNRLEMRNTETPTAIKERLNKAKLEISRAKDYDAEIQIENIQESIKDLQKLLCLN